MASRTPVGVIGVGLMGEVYARRLVAAGFTVIGFDVDPAKNARLANFGAQAGTLADIAQKCEPIVVAVFNTEQVEDVVEHALIPAAAGKIVLVTSTCDPDRIAALGARVGDKLRFLETPVSGTSEQVRQGDGVGLIGGDQKIAADAAPVLDALFAKSFHIGKIGDGGRAKLAVNLILGLNRLALAEGLVFAVAPRARSGGVPRRRPPLGRGLAGHGHQGTENDRRRFRAGGPRPPDAQGHPAHARPGAQGRPAIAASANSRRRATGLRAPRRQRAGQQHRHRGNPPPHIVNAGF